MRSGDGCGEVLCNGSVAASIEVDGDFGNREGGAPYEPVTGHFRAVAEFVEGGVINGLAGLEVHDHHRHLGALHHG